MHYRTCEICGLKSRRNEGIKRFFMARFPLDEVRCRKWVKVTGNEDLAYLPIEKLHELKFVCGKHFKDKDFKKKKTQLKNTAVPTIRLTAKPLSDEKLIGFPCHIFKEQKVPTEVSSSAPAEEIIEPALRVPMEEVPSTSSAHNTDNENLLVNLGKIYNECDIPPVEYTIEVRTTECGNLKKDIPCILAVSEAEGRNDDLVIGNIVYEDNSKNLKVLRKRSHTAKNKNEGVNLKLTPRKKKLVKKLAKYKIKLKQFNQKMKMFNNVNSKALKTMLLSNFTNQNRCSQGKRWTKNDKALAIAMYKKSPKLYRYLRQLVPLPSTRTLQSILSKMPIHPGFNNIIINHLRRKANELSAKEKICVLMFDEMAVKKRLIYNSATDKIEGFQDLGEYGRTGDLADKVLVLLIQGLHKKFKQPIAHYFVKGTIPSEKLSVIIKNAIKKLHELGYKIIATVCDQGPTNVGALNLLKNFSGQPSDSNFFLVEDNKVFIIYDIPHLLKSVRNNFLNGGEIVLDNKKAKWSHLLELQEKNNKTLHFKKITALHVKPKYRAKMKVKLAAQVLSNDIAAILKLYAESFRNEREFDGNLKREAILQTANVIEQLDQLFDITNGPASKNDVKKGIRENVSKNSIHHKLWPEFKNKIKTMHFLKSDSQLRLRNVRCVNGFYITISSLQDIWSYVQSIGFKYLNLRQLNQDTLENMFGLIRQHSPTSPNPTCHHFTAALKTTILTRLSTPIQGANCEMDDNQLMLDFHDLVFQNSEAEDTIDAEHSYISTSDVSEHALYSYDDNDPVLHLPDIETELEISLFAQFDKQPTVYVSGYLASILIKRTQCDKCCNSLRTVTPENNEMYNYIALKEWWKDKLSLTYPTLELCNTVDTCVSVFERDVRPYLHNNDIGNYGRLMMLKDVDLSWLCEEHNKDLMEMLLFRLTQLLIRNECRKINSSINETEQLNSDSNKIAQLMSSAK